MVLCYVGSFVNQEFFDSLIIIMHDVHLTFLCNNRNVKLVTHQRQYQNKSIKIHDDIYNICIDITLMFLNLKSLNFVDLM